MTSATQNTQRPGLVMLRLFGAVILGLAAMLAMRTEAAAQGVCMDRSELANLLGERYAEQTVARGLSSSGQMLEVYATGDGATWTMVMTTPEGHSCVVASGEAWAERLAVKDPDQAV